MTPRHRKFGYPAMGFFWSIWCLDTDRVSNINKMVPFQTPPGKIRKILLAGCSDTLSPSIGCGRMSRVGLLAVRESRDRTSECVTILNCVRIRPPPNIADLAWFPPQFWAGFSRKFERLGRGRANLGGGGYNFKTGWPAVNLSLGHAQVDTEVKRIPASPYYILLCYYHYDRNYYIMFWKKVLCYNILSFFCYLLLGSYVISIRNNVKKRKTLLLTNTECAYGPPATRPASTVPASVYRPVQANNLSHSMQIAIVG